MRTRRRRRRRFRTEAYAPPGGCRRLRVGLGFAVADRSQCENNNGLERGKLKEALASEIAQAQRTAIRSLIGGPERFRQHRATGDDAGVTACAPRLNRSG